MLAWVEVIIDESLVSNGINKERSEQLMPPHVQPISRHCRSLLVLSVDTQLDTNTRTHGHTDRRNQDRIVAPSAFWVDVIIERSVFTS